MLMHLADKLLLGEAEGSQGEGVGGEKVVRQRGAGGREHPHRTVAPGDRGNTRTSSR